MVRNNIISLPRFLIILGCIGIIDKTLVKLWRSWNIAQHSKWFNNQKKMYGMNNCYLVCKPSHSLWSRLYHTLTQCDHYLGFMIVGLWHTHFTNMERYFEYLLGDLGNLGAYMFIMRRIDHQEKSHGNKQKHTHHIQLHACRLPHLSQPYFFVTKETIWRNLILYSRLIFFLMDKITINILKITKFGWNCHFKMNLFIFGWKCVISCMCG